jgi:hypothetical protein
MNENEKEHSDNPSESDVKALMLRRLEVMAQQLDLIVQEMRGLAKHVQDRQTAEKTLLDKLDSWAGRSGKTDHSGEHSR